MFYKVWCICLPIAGLHTYQHFCCNHNNTFAVDTFQRGYLSQWKKNFNKECFLTLHVCKLQALAPYSHSDETQATCQLSSETCLPI